MVYKRIATLVENWIASGVKFIAACGVFSYTLLILSQIVPIKIVKVSRLSKN
jgi:hypothetical protein